MADVIATIEEVKKVVLPDYKLYEWEFAYPKPNNEVNYIEFNETLDVPVDVQGLDVKLSIFIKSNDTIVHKIQQDWNFEKIGKQQNINLSRLSLAEYDNPKVVIQMLCFVKQPNEKFVFIRENAYISLPKYEFIQTDGSYFTVDDGTVSVSFGWGAIRVEDATYPLSDYRDNFGVEVTQGFNPPERVSFADLTDRKFYSKPVKVRYVIDNDGSPIYSDYLRQHEQA